MKIQRPNSNNSNSTNKKSQIRGILIILIILINILSVYSLFESPAFALTIGPGIKLNSVANAISTGTVSQKPINKINYTSALILITNFERIRTQLMLTELNLKNGDYNMAFAHSYITHSVIFPSIKNILENAGLTSSAKKLESGLTDTTFSIKTKDLSTVKKTWLTLNLICAKSMIRCLLQYSIAIKEICCLLKPRHSC